jgi:predicted transposase/invertase (TIGR01784 family)
MEVNKQLINLEVQVKDENDYPERSLYHWARCYAGTLKESEEYINLPRTIAINIVDFVLFKDTKDFHSEFRALEVTRHTELTDRMSLHYFELKKLPNVAESDAGNGLRMWLALFNAKTEEEMAKIEKIGGRTMKQAVHAYRNVIASEKFKNDERLRERARHDEISALAYAKRKGETIGKKKGKAEGKAETQKEIVINMHKAKFSVANIAKATKLSVEDVKLIVKP